MATGSDERSGGLLHLTNRQLLKRIDDARLEGRVMAGVNAAEATRVQLQQQAATLAKIYEAEITATTGKLQANEVHLKKLRKAIKTANNQLQQQKQQQQQMAETIDELRTQHKNQLTLAHLDHEQQMETIRAQHQLNYDNVVLDRDAIQAAFIQLQHQHYNVVSDWDANQAAFMQLQHQYQQQQLQVDHVIVERDQTLAAYIQIQQQQQQQQYQQHLHVAQAVLERDQLQSVVIQLQQQQHQQQSHVARVGLERDQIRTAYIQLQRKCTQPIQKPKRRHNRNRNNMRSLVVQNIVHDVFSDDGNDGSDGTTSGSVDSDIIDLAPSTVSYVTPWPDSLPGDVWGPVGDNTNSLFLSI